MGTEFNADEFTQEMQEKAKALAKTKKEMEKQRTQKGSVTLIINGKKTVHELPCEINDCDVCEEIAEIQFRIDHMMTEMKINLKSMFDGFFENF
jgi:DNA-binding protein YbaB